MVRRVVFLLLGLVLGCGAVVAQSAGIRFHIIDSVSHEAVAGAVVHLSARDDTAENQLYAVAKSDGCGRFDDVPYGNYALDVSSLGYDSLRMYVRVDAPDIVLGDLRLPPRVESLDGVIVRASALRSSVRGDTLSYKADSYKVAFGSDSESLLSKMPGLEVSETGITAQGRPVRRVYVDGREFFGDDILSAIRNIPADLVENIEVYNARSDQDEYSEVDTGEGQTVINIVTRVDGQRGTFGRFVGAYGIPDRYLAGGTVNRFDRERRISVLGLTNNVSRRNFLSGDLSGSTDRSDSPANRNFAMRPMDGISTVHALGINYNDAWGEALQVSASYLFNHTGNENRRHSERRNFTSTDRLVLHDERGETTALDKNHRFRSRIAYKITPSHSILMRTSLDVQHVDEESAMIRRTDSRDQEDLRFISRHRNRSENDRCLFRLSNSILYRFRLPGEKIRNLTVGFEGNVKSTRQSSRMWQYVFRDEANVECDTADYSSRNITRSHYDQPAYGVSGSVGYTHQLHRRFRLNVEYRCGYDGNDPVRSTYVFNDSIGNFLPDRDPRQSTEYGYGYLTHRAGSTLQYHFGRTKISATGSFQHTRFTGRYLFPHERNTEISFDNFVYAVSAYLGIDRNRTLKFEASGRTSNPGAQDLQDVVNTMNRQNVFAGNPDLKPVYTHRFSGHFIRVNPPRGRTFSCSAEFSLRPNMITDSLIIDMPDFVIDDEGTRLGAGNQFVKPVNLSGFWELKTHVGYGFPLRWLRSNLNLKAGISLSQVPSMINGLRNRLVNRTCNLGFVLGSNVSEEVDFRLNYMGYYNGSEHVSRQHALDNTFFSQHVRAEVTATVRRMWVLRADADYRSCRGLADTFHEERLLCNAAVGVKLFHSGLGEFSIGMNDIFDQGRTTFRRVVSGTSLRYVTNLGIGRYLSFRFIYNLRAIR